MERIKKAVSIAVLFSLVLCSCGRDSANLARRSDDNIVAGATKDDVDEVRVGDGGHVVNANGNIWTDGLQATDISKRLRLAGTKEGGTQEQGNYFSNVFSLDDLSSKVVGQARIEGVVTGQERIGRYSNEGIDKTSEKKAFIFSLDNRALSFYEGWLSLRLEGNKGDDKIDSGRSKSESRWGTDNSCIKQGLLPEIVSGLGYTMDSLNEGYGRICAEGNPFIEMFGKDVNFDKGAYSEMCTGVKEVIDKKSLGDKDITKGQNWVKLKNVLNVVNFLFLVGLFSQTTACRSSDSVRGNVSTAERVIKVKYDFFAGDECVSEGVEVKEGEIISIKGALPLMECSLLQSGETICKNSEEGIEREFKGFEQCKLTGSPEHRGYLHDGSIGECLKFVFGETPVVCPVGEKNCSVIILSKGTRGKDRKRNSKLTALDGGEWETSLEWEERIEEAEKKKKEFLDKHYKGDKVAEEVYDEVVGGGKKGREIQKAVAEGKAKRAEEAFMGTYLKYPDVESIRKDYRVAIAGGRDPAVAVKEGIAKREMKRYLEQYKGGKYSKYPGIYRVATEAYYKVLGLGTEEAKRVVEVAVVAEEKKIVKGEMGRYLEQYKEDDENPGIYKVAEAACDSLGLWETEEAKRAAVQAAVGEEYLLGRYADDKEAKDAYDKAVSEGKRWLEIRKAVEAAVEAEKKEGRTYIYGNLWWSDDAGYYDNKSECEIANSVNPGESSTNCLKKYCYIDDGIKYPHPLDDELFNIMRMYENHLPYKFSKALFDMGIYRVVNCVGTKDELDIRYSEAMNKRKAEIDDAYAELKGMLTEEGYHDWGVGDENTDKAKRFERWYNGSLAVLDALADSQEGREWLLEYLQSSQGKESMKSFVLLRNWLVRDLWALPGKENEKYGGGTIFLVSKEGEKWRTEVPEGIAWFNDEKGGMEWLSERGGSDLFLPSLEGQEWIKKNEKGKAWFNDEKRGWMWMAYSEGGLSFLISDDGMEFLDSQRGLEFLVSERGREILGSPKFLESDNCKKLIKSSNWKKFSEMEDKWKEFWTYNGLEFSKAKAGEEFWEYEGLKFSGTKVGEKFWEYKGLKFSGTKAGEEFWAENGLKFSGTKAGEKFWIRDGLEFSGTEIGEKFLKEHCLEFSGTKAGEDFWISKGLEFSGTKVGEEFWAENGLEFSGTKAGEKFWKYDGLDFSETEAGEEFWAENGLKFSGTKAGEDFWISKGLDFSETEIGEEFWISDGLEFSGTKAGEEFWFIKGLDFSETEIGEEFWISDGLKFSETKAGEKFWKYDGLRFSKTEAGEEFLKHDGPKFLETKAGEEFKKANSFFGRLLGVWRNF